MALFCRWDFLTTLWFEWEFLTGKRKFKWTLLLYSTSRIGAVGAVISSLVGFSSTTSIDCQAWITMNLIIIYTSFACTSVLISLRVIAVWDRHPTIVFLTGGMVIVNIAFMIRGTTKFRSIWSAAELGCVLVNTPESRDNITVTVATDIAQLVIMMIGLWRYRRTGQSIVRYMYIQGLVWLVATTLAEIPSAVFINLDLNDAWNLMFQYFSFYTAVICATRMYRDLINYNMDLLNFCEGPVSELRFKTSSVPRTGTAIGIDTTVLPSTRVNTTIAGTEEFEFIDPEKRTPVGDEESQIQKAPSLTSPPKDPENTKYE
ncbi:hypothetical protein BC827DRAFT_125661 [Russula dissimulans]|nr:hypothetical protein BC827DRAFT_125661 [Russula dissimulans]